MSAWRTSSRSMSNGHCVEVASWRTSSRSTFNGNCVEIGSGNAVVGVRDTKLPESHVLMFSSGTWLEFTARVKDEA